VCKRVAVIFKLWCLDPELWAVNVWAKEVVFQFSLAFKVAIMTLDRSEV
jgi:hypothetical protein